MSRKRVSLREHKLVVPSLFSLCICALPFAVVAALAWFLLDSSLHDLVAPLHPTVALTSHRCLSRFLSPVYLLHISYTILCALFILDLMRRGLSSVCFHLV